MLRIKIVGKKVKYDVTLKNRVTVIAGRDNLFAYKFVDLLEYRDYRPGYTYEISGSEEDFEFAGYQSLRIIKKAENLKDKPIVYLVDDDSENKEVVQELIKDASLSYFILFTQNIYLPSANYSMSDVYEMRRVDGWQTLVPAYPERIKTEPELREWYASLCRDKGCRSIQFV